MSRKSETINIGLADWDDSALISAYDSAVQSYMVPLVLCTFITPPILILLTGRTQIGI